MAKRNFTTFTPRPKPRKRPRRHKKSRNKSEKRDHKPYNPQARNSKLESIFNKNKILEKYYDGESVRTVYGRTIKADLHHALNYIIQSTTSDLFLRQVIETNKIFKDKKSYISFSIHDSFVIDASNVKKYIYIKYRNLI